MQHALGVTHPLTEVSVNTAILETARRALVIVDIQNDYFPGGLLPLTDVEAAKRKALQAVQAFRMLGALVVHIRHEFTDENAPLFRPGSAGARLHPDAINLPNEHVVLKRHINAFRDTTLGGHLQSNGIKDVVIVGNMTHMCVDAITRTAVDLGYSTTVLHDACATLDIEWNGVKVPARQVHAAFMAALGFGYARVMSTDEYLRMPGETLGAGVENSRSGRITST